MGRTLSSKLVRGEVDDFVGFDLVQGPAGEPMPNVTLHDGAGRPFELESLKGKVSVLVFGCLT
jgi:cytochrome oxidase Cu insertion factor (SCO1/SenC/PrrC family)